MVRFFDFYKKQSTNDKTGRKKYAPLNIAGKCLITIIVVIMAILVYHYLDVLKGYLGIEYSSRLQIKIKYLKEKYKNQENDTWKKIQASLEDERVGSLVCLCLINDETCDNFTNDLIETFNEKLNVNDVKYRKLKGVKEFGEVLYHYIHLIKQNKVLLVDLEDIDSLVAPMFHSLCNYKTPVVEKSLVIFKLRIEKKIQNSADLVKISKNLLSNKWNSLQENELTPLLARILSTIVFLEPETNINNL